MTVKTDLAVATGVHRRLYLRIDGHKLRRQHAVAAARP